MRVSHAAPSLALANVLITGSSLTDTLTTPQHLTLCWMVVFLRVLDYDTSALEENVLIDYLAHMLEHDALKQPVNETLPYMTGYFHLLARYEDDLKSEDLKVFWQKMWDKFDEKARKCQDLFKNKPFKKWQLFLLVSCQVKVHVI